MNHNYLFLLGSMKAGTTTFFHHLVQHPRVCRAKKKEIDYFIDLNYTEDLKDYNNHFDFNPETHQYRIDASTSFTKYPVQKKVPLNIFEAGIKPKMVFIVRNPIDRINSEINFWRNFPHWSHPKEKKNLDAIVARSSYNMQLAQYLPFFSKDDILIVDFDMLKTNSQIVFDEVCDFCNLEKFILQKTDVVANKTETKSNLELRLLKNNRKIINLTPLSFRQFGKKILRSMSKTSKWQLSKKEETEIKIQLKRDMLAFQDNYGFNVDKWGF